MKWHCGVCLYYTSQLDFSEETRKIIGTRNYTGRLPKGAIFARPFPCKQRTVLVKNANPIRAKHEDGSP